MARHLLALGLGQRLTQWRGNLVEALPNAVSAPCADASGILHSSTRRVQHSKASLAGNRLSREMQAAKPSRMAKK